MAKATLSLPNGTSVQIEGTTDEVKKLLEFYGGEPSRSTNRRASPRAPLKKQHRTTEGEDASVDLANIVNLAKDCDEADKIESQILDRTSQVDRTLLPLYIVHEHLDNSVGLTTGEISKITKNLGIPIATANVSHTLSGAASRYVMGDKVKKKGQPVRYKLSRRGVKYVKAVLEGTEGED
jgi:hypothetical protein